MSDHDEANSPEYITHDYGTQTSIAVNNDNENANQNANADGEENEATTAENIAEESDNVVAEGQGGEEAPLDEQPQEAKAPVEGEATANEEAKGEEKAEEEGDVSEEKTAGETAPEGGQEGKGEKTDGEASTLEVIEAEEQNELPGEEGGGEQPPGEEDAPPPDQVEETVGEQTEEATRDEQPVEEPPVEEPPGEEQPVEEQPVEEQPVAQPEGEQPQEKVKEEPQEATEEQAQEDTGEKSEEVVAAPEAPSDEKPVEPEGDQPVEEETSKEQPPTVTQEEAGEVQEEKVAAASQSMPESGEDVVEGKEEDMENEGEEKELAVHIPEQSDYYKDATATVKFVLMPSGQVATQRCRLSETLGELKEQFSEELKIPVSMILLLYNGKNIANEMTLAGLGVGPTAMVQLEMQSADPINNPIKQFPPRQEYHMPDVITVRVQAEDGVGYKDVVVEIERCTRRKPFLGGFRHRVTGSEFHNAAAQTLKKPKPPTGKILYCRDTQTVEERHLMQQTTNDMSTQMTKVGVYVTTDSDRLVVPQKYTTADEREKFILEQVVMLQKYYRRWLSRKYVQKVRQDTERRMEWERQEELRKKNEKEERIRREFERRMNPKTREDFDLLYHALEKWRQDEVENINKTLTGAERKAALCQLLEQETELIASIGRHKIDSEAENRVLRIQRFLSKAAAPKRWRGFDGRQMEMMTPYSIRAEELKEIYNSINMKYLTQDERLDVLLTLKHTVKEHDCKLTQDIIELIDREADLLMRGVREMNLDGLRRRISTLFLQYLKTPTFNPRIAKLLKVPQDPSVLRQNIYFCPSCEQYLQSTEFQLSSNSRVVGNCRNCNKVDNDARVRQDYSHYRFMLRQLRREEEAYGDDSKIAFLMQEKDLRYLVENVWNSQSILSAWEDLYDLVLVRWDRFTEWSPWNCILLTKEEASAHNQLASLTEAYGSTFMHKVEHKHTLARSYFSRLPGMADLLRRACEKKVKANEQQSVQGKGLTTKSARSGKPTKAY